LRQGGASIYKVVIVDDEPIIVHGLQRAVDWERFGCAVVGSAFDAADGAACIRRFSPDILFTDIRMPDEDGISMLAGLKSEFPYMQVTVLTGHREFDYAQQALKLGVSRFLLKPSKMAEIEEALESMTQKLRERPERETEKSGGEQIGERTEAGRFIVNAAIKYIQRHCVEKLTLLEVADKVYVSQWHLSKLLNRYMKKNFYDMLNEARIEKAKELLRDPKFRIGEVSEMVGFSDISHFSRIFKKAANISPKEYRNNIMNISVYEDEE